MLGQVFIFWKKIICSYQVWKISTFSLLIKITSTILGIFLFYPLHRIFNIYLQGNLEIVRYVHFLLFLVQWVHQNEIHQRKFIIAHFHVLKSFPNVKLETWVCTQNWETEHWFPKMFFEFQFYENELILPLAFAR